MTQAFEPQGITADMVMIDEAGQLGLGIAALVIRFLSSRGKLVLAGDHQQLAPILGTSYPESEGTPPLFGSVLDTLMSGRRELRRASLGTARNRADSTESQTTEESDGTVVQLLENWRCAYCQLYTLCLTVSISDLTRTWANLWNSSTQDDSSP